MRRIQLYFHNLQNTAPMVWVLVPFMIGIVGQWYLSPSIFLSTGIAIGLLAFFAIYFMVRPSIQYRLRSITYLLVTFFILIAGMLIAWLRQDLNNPTWFGHTLEGKKAIVLTLTEPPIERDKTYKAEAKVIELIGNDSSYSHFGKCLLYFEKSNQSASLQYGDQLIISNQLQAINNSGNPGAFDYKRYASFQHLYHQAFLKDGDYKVIKKDQGNAFNKIMFQCRDFIIQVIKKYVSPDKKINGVAQALLIGYKKDLDKDLVQAYSNTGVVHIIAISGLHLGLIYLLLYKIAESIPGLRKNRLLKTILIIGCLWIFSVITGLPASVVRSAMMFTLIVIGKYYFGNTQTVNLLAGSAFVLLCFNPFYIWDVGFQLSYLAVIGIFWLQKPIENWFYIKKANFKSPREWPRGILKFTWQLLSVSLAAQALTLPVTLYNFHQMPMAFLFTNLVAVPVSTGILYAELLLLLFSWFTPLATIIGKLISISILWLNNLIEYADSLTVLRIDRIYATPLSSWLLMLFIVVACSALFFRYKKLWYWGMGLLVAFSFLHLYYSYQSSRKHQLIVYNVPGKQAIDFRSGSQYAFVGDSSLSIPGGLQNFHLNGSRNYLHIKEELPLEKLASNQQPYIQFKNHVILLAKPGLFFPRQPEQTKIFCIIISGNPNWKMKYLADTFDPEWIIFDSSNKLYKIQQWKKECSELHLRCHAVNTDGAFTANLNP